MIRNPSREFLTASEHLALHRKGHPFKVAADPLVRAFIDKRLPKMTLSDLAIAARREFGTRAPSRSAIARYWRGLSDQDRRRLIEAAQHQNPQNSAQNS